MAKRVHVPGGRGLLSTRLLLTGTLLAGAFSGCRAPTEPTPRLVLLYATCTLNRDYLAPYRPAVSSTPHLAAFAREAVVFRRHQTEAGQSGTAFAALFTGTQADRHGVFRHPTPLGVGVETIGEAFRDAGFDVHTWLEHPMASDELGYARGAAPESIRTDKLIGDDPRFLAILERLRRDPEYRALVVTNFTVTHGPYQTASMELFCGSYPGECKAAREDPEAFERYADFYRRSHAFLSYDFPATRQRTAMSDEHLANLVEVIDLLYRANVSYLDLLFGSVTEAIRGAGLWDESAVVFTADHGETLYREGTLFKWTHGHQLAPEVLGVPLLVRAPGVAAGDWAAVSRSIDVLPTLAGLAGVELAAPQEGHGADLSPALRGRAAPPRSVAYSHTALLSEPVAAASPKWGLFHALHPRSDPELMWVQRRDGDRVVQLRRGRDGELSPAVFDLVADPHMLDNLFDPRDAAQRRAVRDLRDYRERLIRAWHARRGDELDLGRQEELLRSLSYID